MCNKPPTRRMSFNEIIALSSAPGRVEPFNLMIFVKNWQIMPIFGTRHLRMASVLSSDRQRTAPHSVLRRIVKSADLLLELSTLVSEFGLMVCLIFVTRIEHNRLMSSLRAVCCLNNMDGKINMVAIGDRLNDKWAPYRLSETACNYPSEFTMNYFSKIVSGVRKMDILR